jgi:hypothetical protein
LIVTGAISTEQLISYRRDGVVFPIRVFTPEETSSFRSALDAIVEESEGEPLKRLGNLHLFFPWAYRLVTHHELLNAIESVLGSNLLVDGTLVFYKRPQDSSYVSWHQDSVYSGWHLTPSASAWIALSHSDASNGCMRVIPGSHRLGQLTHVNVRDDANLVRRGERVEEVDENAAVDVVLRPGEMSLHESTLVHGSKPNVSREARIGFIVRFVTSDVTNHDRLLLRVRGEADCSHLMLAKPPANIDHGAALAAWRAATAF